jgi:Zn finger protein HypA/HybF involved in hydrogenase expression
MDQDARDVAREQARWRDIAELGYIRPEHCDHHWPSDDRMAKCLICGAIKDCYHPHQLQRLGNIYYCPDCGAKMHSVGSEDAVFLDEDI